MSYLSFPLLSSRHVSPQVLPLVGALTEKLTLCSETISIRRYPSIFENTHIRLHLQYLFSFVQIQYNLIIWRQLLITMHLHLHNAFVCLAFAKPFPSLTRKLNISICHSYSCCSLSALMYGLQGMENHSPEVKQLVAAIGVKLSAADEV